MCIARFLADIVSPRATAITRRDRRQRAIFDYTISFGVPFATMACHIIYQPNRFSIVRNVGCSPTSLMSWPTLLLRTIWPPVFAIIAVLYSSQFFQYGGREYMETETWSFTQPTPSIVSFAIVATLAESSQARTRRSQRPVSYASPPSPSRT